MHLRDVMLVESEFFRDHPVQLDSNQRDLAHTVRATADGVLHEFAD
jgi:hypothetical protein